VNFAAGGLNGDVEAVSLSNGVAIFNTEIGNGATAEVGASFSSVPNTAAQYTFTSGSGLLKLDDPWSFNGTVHGAITGDIVQLVGVKSAQILQFASRTDPTFRIEDPSTGKIATIQFAPTEDFTNASFGVGDLTKNGDFSIEVFRSAVCFMPGTRIRIPEGYAAVEMLRRGDLVLTADGHTKPVNWIGRQTVSTTFGDPLRILPIRIRANALEDNVPSRDLLVSPDHAIHIGGILVQAGALVNGTSIVRETNVPQTFTYYHIEVDQHALILAEETPAETFVDNVERLAFDNWSEYEALYPEGKSIEELALPRAKAHRQVPPALRKCLAERAPRLCEDIQQDVA
jgi:hypothetical protein